MWKKVHQLRVEIMPYQLSYQIRRGLSKHMIDLANADRSKLDVGGKVRGLDRRGVSCLCVAAKTTTDLRQDQFAHVTSARNDCWIGCVEGGDFRQRDSVVGAVRKRFPSFGADPDGSRSWNRHAQNSLMVRFENDVRFAVAHRVQFGEGVVLGEHELYVFGLAQGAEAMGTFSRVPRVIQIEANVCDRVLVQQPTHHPCFVTVKTAEILMGVVVEFAKGVAHELNGMAIVEMIDASVDLVWRKDKNRNDLIHLFEQPQKCRVVLHAQITMENKQSDRHLFFLFRRRKKELEIFFPPY